jgi:hypothetical protein
MVSDATSAARRVDQPDRAAGGKSCHWSAQLHVINLHSPQPEAITVVSGLRVTQTLNSPA